MSSPTILDRIDNNIKTERSELDGFIRQIEELAHYAPPGSAGEEGKMWESVRNMHRLCYKATAKLMVIRTLKQNRKLVEHFIETGRIPADGGSDEL